MFPGWPGPVSPGVPPGPHGPASDPPPGGPRPSGPLQGPAGLTPLRRREPPGPAGTSAGGPAHPALSHVLPYLQAPDRARLEHAVGYNVRELRAGLVEAGVQGETLEVLNKLLMAAHPVAGTPPAQMARLVDQAEQAVCAMLAGPGAPSPAAAQAAANALMTGIQTLPDGPQRADRAAAAFLKAFDSVPRPSTSADLPAYGRRLEATGLAILTAATRVPENELAIGLDVMARFSGVMLDKIPTPTGGLAAADHQRLMDSVVSLNSAVLRTIDTLPPQHRPGPLAHLGGHMKQLWCDIDQPENRRAAEVPYLRAAADLLAALARLPAPLRHAPLQALGQSIDATTGLQAWPRPLRALQQFVAGLANPAYAPPDYHALLDEPIGPVHAPQAPQGQDPLASQADMFAQFNQLMQANMQTNMWTSMMNRPTC